jgi:PKD repeat protein
MPMLLASALFAGCLGGDDVDPLDEESNGDDDAHGGDEGNETMAPAVNTPPMAALTASTTNATVPANVTFNITFQDADGDDLTWSLDVTGDGEAETEALAVAADGVYLPVNFTYSYDAVGLFNVTLSVRDLNETFTATLQVNVTQAVAGGNATTQEVTGSWLAGATMVGCFGDIFGVGYPGALDGILYSSFDVDPGTYGLPYTVTVTSSLPQDSPGFSFLDEAGDIVHGGFLGDVASGNVPSGAVTGVFWTCLGAAMEGNYHAG